MSNLRNIGMWRVSRKQNWKGLCGKQWISGCDCRKKGSQSSGGKRNCMKRSAGNCYRRLERRKWGRRRKGKKSSSFITNTGRGKWEKKNILQERSGKGTVRKRWRQNWPGWKQRRKGLGRGQKR